MVHASRSLLLALWLTVLCGGGVLVLEAAPDTPPVDPEAASQPEAAADEPEVVTTESGLQWVDLEVGMGPPVRKGDRVEVHYLGWLPGGAVFDSSRARNRTFRFRVGRREVVKGWDEGLIGMQVGGKRRLLVPPELGYGKRGAGDKIPPDASLFFEIELVGIR